MKATNIGKKWPRCRRVAAIRNRRRQSERASTQRRAICRQYQVAHRAWRPRSDIGLPCATIRIGLRSACCGRRSACCGSGGARKSLGQQPPLQHRSAEHNDGNQRRSGQELAAQLGEPSQRCIFNEREPPICKNVRSRPQSCRANWCGCRKRFSDPCRICGQI